MTKQEFKNFSPENKTFEWYKEHTFAPNKIVWYSTKNLKKVTYKLYTLGYIELNYKTDKCLKMLNAGDKSGLELIETLTI